VRRHRRIARRPHHDRWLVSYADFITLLFAFFVVMYSAAQLDKRRLGELATAIQTAFEQRGSLPPMARRYRRVRIQACPFHSAGRQCCA
jgi:flagellar motor protein MotB